MFVVDGGEAKFCYSCENSIPPGINSRSRCWRQGYCGRNLVDDDENRRRCKGKAAQGCLEIIYLGVPFFEAKIVLASADKLGRSNDKDCSTANLSQPAKSASSSQTCMLWPFLIAWLAFAHLDHPDERVLK